MLKADEEHLQCSCGEFDSHTLHNRCGYVYKFAIKKHNGRQTRADRVRIGYFACYLNGRVSGLHPFYGGSIPSQAT
jgi:hypothetical protein